MEKSIVGDKMDNKINKQVKKFLDRELRQYKLNKKKLIRLEEKEKGIEPSRVTIMVKERTEYIDNVIMQLNPFEKEVFKLIFFEGRDWLYCEINKNISKSTYYNIYNKIISLLAEEWGEI